MMVKWFKATVDSVKPTAKMGESELRLSLRTPNSKLDEIKKLLDGGHYELILQRRVKRRSLTANSYCWVVCDAIAKAVKSTKEDVYRRAIKQVGVWDTVSVSKAAYERFKVNWEKQGTGWLVDPLGDDGVMVQCATYYGSSTYTSSEMARLIDWLVEEAEGLELDVLPPKERSLLIEKVAEAIKKGEGENDG